MRSLLLGSGRDWRKKVIFPKPEWAGDLVTVDMDPNCGATLQWDLEKRPLPFDDESFAEIHAYDVLEHVGRQGDWRDFFDQFAEYWRLLIPGGIMGILVPIGPDLLVDPGHSRFYHAKHFYMLSQDWYEQNFTEHSGSGGDYRWYWKRNFNVLHLQQLKDNPSSEAHHIVAVLQKS